jgi:peptidoglycan hydrolase CwlO-like protein
MIMSKILTEAVLSQQARIEAIDRDIADYQAKIDQLTAMKAEFQKDLDELDVEYPEVKIAMTSVAYPVDTTKYP